MIVAKNVYGTRRGLIVVDRHAGGVRARTHARITVALRECSERWLRFNVHSHKIKISRRCSRYISILMFQAASAYFNALQRVMKAHDVNDPISEFTTKPCSRPLECMYVIHVCAEPKVLFLPVTKMGVVTMAGKYWTREYGGVHARDSLVRRRQTRHCTARGISAAAYAPPFTDNRLPKKVEQQTTSALFTRRATLRPHCPAVKRNRFAFYAYKPPRRRRCLLFCISLISYLLHVCT